jgi:lysophospholipase L1-like esterase
MQPFITRRAFMLVQVAFLLFPTKGIFAAESVPHLKWVASWSASPQGPYPSGFPVAQPDLSFAFPTPSNGANDQTLRLIVKPDLWGKQMRLQFSNVFGTKPVSFDKVFLGMQATGAHLVPGTNRPVTFNSGQPRVTLAPGQQVYSDTVALRYINNANSPELSGRKLCVSFHVVGSSGPMTWHAKALTTSYLTLPKAGPYGKDESDQAFSLTTTSWFFLTGVEVMARDDTVVVAAFGDSLTDGTASTLNGDDRWPDFLSRRLHAVYGARVSVINAGIGGNQVVGPAVYTAENPSPGGPSALQRLDRDVLGLAGLTAVVWMEGINDFGMSATPQGTPLTSADAVISGFQEGARRLLARGIKVIIATLTSSLNSQTGSYGTAEVDASRKAVNSFIRGKTIFDSVADFDAVTIDPSTGTLRAEFRPNSTVGGSGDLIHPNRAGYQAMANAIDLQTLTSSKNQLLGGDEAECRRNKPVKIHKSR